MANRFVVHTLDALCDATKRVHRASKSALGPASIREIVACRALHRVTASRAISAALEIFPAVINVREYVAKYVLKTTV